MWEPRRVALKWESVEYLCKLMKMNQVKGKSDVTGKRGNSLKDSLWWDYGEKGSQRMWKNKFLGEGETHFHYFRKKGKTIQTWKSWGKCLWSSPLLIFVFSMNLRQGLQWEFRNEKMEVYVANKRMSLLERIK